MTILSQLLRRHPTHIWSRCCETKKASIEMMSWSKAKHHMVPPFLVGTAVTGATMVSMASSTLLWNENDETKDARLDHPYHMNSFGGSVTLSSSLWSPWRQRPNHDHHHHRFMYTHCESAAMTTTSTTKKSNIQRQV